MIPEYMGVNSHRIMSPEVSRLSGTVQESDIQSTVAFINIYSSFQYVVAFIELAYFYLFRSYQGGFWRLALTHITHLFDTFSHCGKANISRLS